MRPRLDPDTRPVAVAAQIIKRRQTNKYGVDRGRRAPNRLRPFQTRNGLPAARYRYQGTGQSLSEAEAAAYLTTRKRGPHGTVQQEPAQHDQRQGMGAHPARSEQG